MAVVVFTDVSVSVTMVLVVSQVTESTINVWIPQALSYAVSSNTMILPGVYSADTSPYD